MFYFVVTCMLIMKSQHGTFLIVTISAFYFRKGLECKFNRIIPIISCQDHRHFGILELYSIPVIKIFTNRLADRRRRCVSIAIPGTTIAYFEGMKIGVIGSPDNCFFFLIPLMQPLITSRDFEFALNVPITPVSLLFEP